jgi:branched-subunit amino acid transport protein
VAMIYALVATLLTGQGAAVIAARTRRLWACILGGMALYWLLRLATG